MMTFSFNQETIDAYKEVKAQETEAEFLKQLEHFVAHDCTPEEGETHKQIFDELLRQVNQMTFKEWQATRERITDNAEAVVGLHMYGDDDWKSDECVATHVYDTACIEEHQDDDGKTWFFTMLERGEHLSGTLEECEAILWDHFAKYEYRHKGDEGCSGFRQSFTQFRENRHEVAKDRAKLWDNCFYDLDDVEIGYAYAAGSVPQILELKSGDFYAEFENSSVTVDTLYEAEAKLWDEWYAVEYSDSCKPREKNEAFDDDPHFGIDYIPNADGSDDPLDWHQLNPDAFGDKGETA